jgi:hypothetical protein
MRKQQKLTRPTDIFRRKVIITFPPWGVFLFGAIVAVSLGLQITRMLVIFLLIIVLCALTASVIQHRLMNELRHSIHNLLHDIENERFNAPPSTFEEYIATDKPERIPLKDIKANGSKPSVSKRS